MTRSRASAALRRRSGCCGKHRTPIRQDRRRTLQRQLERSRRRQVLRGDVALVSAVMVVGVPPSATTQSGPNLHGTNPDCNVTDRVVAPGTQTVRPTPASPPRRRRDAVVKVKQGCPSCRTASTRYRRAHEDHDCAAISPWDASSTFDASRTRPASCPGRPPLGSPSSSVPASIPRIAPHAGATPAASRHPPPAASCALRERILHGEQNSHGRACAPSHANVSGDTLAHLASMHGQALELGRSTLFA